MENTNLSKVALVFLCCLIYTHALGQEAVQIFEQEEITLPDPYETNKYYFSLLPSTISMDVLTYFTDDFRQTWKPEFALRQKIDKDLVTNKMSNAAFWGSFNITRYEDCLFCTAFVGGNSVCAQLFLARGKHPTNSRGYYGSSSPLALAVFANHPAIVCILLAAGADPNHKDCKYSEYPICKAAQNNNVECVRLLLAKGANKDLEQALQWGTKNNSTEVVRLLLAAGADPNTVVSGHKAIIEAAGNQNADMVQLLINYGAKISTKRYHLRYALQYALDTHNTALASILQNAGVKLP